MHDAIAPTLDRLRGYLASDPQNIELLAATADAAIREGEGADALEYVDRALQLTPGHAPFRYRRAVALRRLGRSEEALEILNDLSASAEAPAPVLNELADLQFQRRDFAAACAVLERISSLPDYRAQVPLADMLHVRALHYLGRVDDAIARAEAALAARPQQPELEAALATLYLDASRMKDAATLYQTAQARGVASAELLSVGGYLALEAQDLAAAQERFGRALQLRPKDGRALLGAGLARAAAADLPQAVTLLQQAAAAMPTHLGTLNALAWMQLLSGDVDAAESTFHKANAVDHSFADNHGGLAVAAALKGNAAHARELIRTAQKLDRESFSAAYASMLLQHGSPSSTAMLESMMTFLGRQPIEGGGDMKQMVLGLLARQRRR